MIEIVSPLAGQANKVTKPQQHATFMQFKDGEKAFNFRDTLLLTESGGSSGGTSSPKNQIEKPKIKLSIREDDSKHQIKTGAMDVANIISPKEITLGVPASSRKIEQENLTRAKVAPNSVHILS